MPLIDQVRKTYNERYVLSVSKDHHRGVVVQVARLNPTHVADNNGEISVNHKPVVLMQKVISLGKPSKTGDIEFDSKENIAQLLNIAIQQADQFVAKCMESETSVDEILMELNKQFNG